MTEKNEKVIALLGQPNSGKSTLFNALTGLKQHVGNWPGKTVEKKEGNFEYKQEKYLVADLPGTYSLSANSDEEIITRDYIASGKADVVCILADFSQLHRSLYMLADYAGISLPTFLILNMSDVAAEQGKKIDADAISKKLGIPVVLFSAQDKKNYDNFYKALEKALSEQTVLNASALEAKYETIPAYKEIKNLITDDIIPGYSSRWLAAKAVEGDAPVCAKNKASLNGAKASEFEKLASVEKRVLLTGEAKFKWIDEILGLFYFCKIVFRPYELRSLDIGNYIKNYSTFVEYSLGHTSFARLAIGNYIKKAHSAFAKWALGHLRLELRTKGL